jgi:hypothetical protein
MLGAAPDDGRECQDRLFERHSEKENEAPMVALIVEGLTCCAPYAVESAKHPRSSRIGRPAEEDCIMKGGKGRSRSN